MEGNDPTIQGKNLLLSLLSVSADEGVSREPLI